MSVLRLHTKGAGRFIELRDRVLQAWRAYTDEDAFVFAQTDDEPHDTVTSIVGKVQDMYELDLVLCNNITMDEFPLDVYHSHQELHHIKKESTGLIEVMGLAILPSRLKTELAELGQYIIEGRDIRNNGTLEKHGDRVGEFLPKYEEKGIVVTPGNVQDILQEEARRVFAGVLEDVGVYECDTRGHEISRKLLKSMGFAGC